MRAATLSSVGLSWVGDRRVPWTVGDARLDYVDPLGRVWRALVVDHGLLLGRVFRHVDGTWWGTMAVGLPTTTGDHGSFEELLGRMLALADAAEVRGDDLCA